MGNNNNGGSSMMIIGLVVCVCCCCVSSMAPVGVYFAYPPFKDWVNNLLGGGGDSWSCTLMNNTAVAGNVTASNAAAAIQACYNAHVDCSTIPGGCYVKNVTHPETASKTGPGYNYDCYKNSDFSQKINKDNLNDKKDGPISSQTSNNYYPNTLADASWACNAWRKPCGQAKGGCFAVQR